MKLSLRLTLFLSLLLFSCNQHGIDDNIYWVESNAICVHWSDYGKKNFDTKAIRIVLRSSDSKMYDGKEFYLNTVVDEEVSFLLGKVTKLKSEGNNFFLFLFIRSEDLYDLFPKGMNRNNDDCYLLELANMIGQGQIVMEDNEDEIRVATSKDYSFHLGPK